MSNYAVTDKTLKLYQDWVESAQEEFRLNKAAGELRVQLANLMGQLAQTSYEQGRAEERTLWLEQKFNLAKQEVFEQGLSEQEKLRQSVEARG